MILKRILLFAFLLLNNLLIAQDTLFINRGIYSIPPETIHKISINNKASFNRINTVVNIDISSSSEFFIKNNDSVTHILDGEYIDPLSIEPNEIKLLVLENLSFGTHLIHFLNSPGKLLGGGLIVTVGLNNVTRYCWDLWDQSPALAKDIFEGNITAIPTEYRPTFFSINGGVDPMDTTNGAFIKGHLYDSIYISVVNTGNMIHNMHFHGYHVKILQSTAKPIMNGWEKDSFPIFIKDAMTLLLVPHQLGKYPVHNHNLVTTLFNNTSSFGMITMIMIEDD